MKIFNTQKTTKDNEYETINKRIIDVCADVELLKQKVSSLEYENNTLRDKVLRKIQHKEEIVEIKNKQKLKAGEKYTLKK